MNKIYSRQGLQLAMTPSQASAALGVKNAASRVRTRHAEPARDFGLAQQGNHGPQLGGKNICLQAPGAVEMLRGDQLRHAGPKICEEGAG